MANEDHRGIRSPGNAYDFQRARRLNVSTNAITSGVAVADSTTVAHGLGLTPTGCWATAHQNQHMASANVWDSVNLTVTLRRPDGGAINSGFTWGAFG